VFNFPTQCNHYLHLFHLHCSVYILQMTTLLGSVMKPVFSDRLVYQDKATSDTLHHRPYIGVARPTVVPCMTRSIA
jgi:hypothetical protein